MPGATSTDCGEDQVAATPTILLVEDNEDSVLTVADYLEFKGLHVVVVRSGSEALAFCHAALPALIRMDIQMPGMSGLEAIERLRQQPATAATPIIAVTALAMPGDRDRCLRAGANDYVSKPLHMRSLHEIVLRYLQAA
jgi:CheY-like chemotaxis protein